MSFTNVKICQREREGLLCVCKLAVRLFIMAARKILEDVVEMLLHSGHTDHRCELPKSWLFQVRFFATRRANEFILYFEFIL